MKLHPIIATHDTKTNWCGPAALAAITGMGTGAAREICKQAIKEDLGRTHRRLMGIYTDELLRAIELYSVKHALLCSFTWDQQISVARALHKYQPVNGNLLLIFCKPAKDRGHVVVADSKKIVDNNRPQGADYFDHPYINSMATRIYELSDVTCEDL